MRFTRRDMLKAAAITGTGVVGLSALSSPQKPPGVIMTPTEFFKQPQVTYYGGYPTSHIPIELRQPNTNGSCVHLATAVCLVNIGEYDLARMWTNNFGGGEYASRHIRRLEDAGILFSVETNGDPAYIDFWMDSTSVTKRILGVNYNTRHVMNLLDIDSAGPNAKAYLLNNQRKSGSWAWDSAVAAETTRDEFLRNWDRNGGWAFAILGTTEDGHIAPTPPIPA